MNAVYTTVSSLNQEHVKKVGKNHFGDDQAPRGILKKVQFDGYLMDCTAVPDYPQTYANGAEVMYVCETCFTYTTEKDAFDMHQLACKPALPPGTLLKSWVGPDGENLHMYEIVPKKTADGFIGAFLQNVKLFGTCFLSGKNGVVANANSVLTILCSTDEFGCHPIGYSCLCGAKACHDENTFSTFVVFPHHRGKGYADVLIEQAYSRTGKPLTVGPENTNEIRPKHLTPMRPFSFAGLLTHQRYWDRRVKGAIKTRLQFGKEISVMDLCDSLGMTKQDVLNTLVRLGLMTLESAYSNTKVSMPLELVEQKVN